MKRTEIIEKLAREISRQKRPHPVRVAIDGVDAAGKTILADELVKPIETLGRKVIRASIDGREPTELELDFPKVTDGVRGMRFVDAVVRSNGAWVEM